MIAQINRRYELIIGDVRAGTGLEITDLHVSFDISKSVDNKTTPSSATIEIYNLSDESLKRLDTDYPAAVFSAGYKDVEIKRLFAGEVKDFTTRKSGTDRITQIRMGAAYKELNHQTLNQLTAPGRSVQDVLEEIRKAIPNVSRGVYNGTNLSSQLIYGYPLMGTPKDMLNELSRKYSLNWNIDDDVLYVHSSDRGFTENFNQAVVIAPDSGLIEIPYRAVSDNRRSEKDKAKSQAVQWTMLLNPTLVPGSIVKIEDTDLDGWYRLDEVRHSGGWRDNPWYTECRASAIVKVRKDG